MNWQPLHNFVLIEPINEATDSVSKGGIVIPDKAKQLPQKGAVISAGPGKLNDKGERPPMSVEVGDTVIFNKWGAIDVEIDGENYFIFTDDGILLKLED